MKERKAFIKYDGSPSDPNSPRYTGPVELNRSSRIPITEEEVYKYCTPGFLVQDINGMIWDKTDKETTHSYHELYTFISKNYKINKYVGYLELWAGKKLVDNNKDI